MRKITTKILASFCVIGLAVANCSFSILAEDVKSAPQMSEGAKMLERMYEEETVVSENDEISVQSVLTEDQSRKFDQFSGLVYYFQGEAEEGKEYPDYISGIYYDEEEEEIVVTTTGDKAFVEEKLSSAVSDLEGISIKKVAYTYTELQMVKNYIEDKCQDILNSDNIVKNNLVERINSVVIMENENCVTVSIENYSEEEEQLFRELLSVGKTVTFAAADAKAYSTTLKPGMKVSRVKLNSIWHSYSVGCRAWRVQSSGQYQYGFITAGHSNEVGDEFFITTNNTSNNYIGFVSDKTVGGNCDAAFVNVENSNYKLSNVVMYMDDTELAAGKYVYNNFMGAPCVAVGAKSGTFRMGKIVNDTYSCNISTTNYYPNNLTSTLTVPINDLLQTNFEMIEGDSGGLLMTKSGTQYCVAGIVSSGEAGKTNFVKYCNILDKLKYNIY